MDVQKTKAFYEGTGIGDLCQCAYCRNYVQQIGSVYPEVAEFLETLGADIEKPFETSPLEPENGYLDYISAQYIIMGSREGFQNGMINEVSIRIADSHPATGIPEEHFVIELFPIRLSWNGLRDMI